MNVTGAERKPKTRTLSNFNIDSNYEIMTTAKDEQKWIAWSLHSVSA